MATFKYILQSKNNPAPIYLRLSLNRSQVYRRKTGLFINPKEWSADKAYPKQTLADNKKITLKLKDLEVALAKDLNNTLAKGETINGDWLQYHIDLHFERITESKQSELLVDAIQDIIDNAPTQRNGNGGLGLSTSRIKSYQQLKRLIIEFQKKENFKVKEVGVNFANNFLKWLLNKKKYNKGFALKSIDNLKTVCKNANAQGITVHNTLNSIKSARVKNENIIYLTPLELEKIEKATIVKESLKNARKWLLLGCNIGQRGGDLLSITEDNFKKVGNLSVIEIEQQKTGKLVLIPVNEKVQSIYDGGLPYAISLTKFNSHLKELCKVAELDVPTQGAIYKTTENGKRKVADIYPKYELITSHVCRRSFCSNYYGKMPTNLIMQISGHSTEKMLLTYIGKKAPDYLQEIAHYFAIEEQRNKKETKLSIVKNAVNQ